MNYILTPPSYVICSACEVLTHRLTNIKEEIVESDGDIPHYSDLLEITKYGQLTEYKFINESWTIGQLLRHYIYKICPEITHVTTSNEHAYIHTIIINIIHSQSQKILMTAIDIIISDLKIVSKAFE